MNERPYLRIGQLAELTGVEIATLRTWESRYGVPRGDRTPGGQRRYPESEVERVRSIVRLIDAGYRPAEAARVARDTWNSEPPLVSQEELLALFLKGNLDGLRALDDMVARRPLETVLVDVVAPLLREVGSMWARGDIGVGEEHAASALVAAWLGSQVRTLPAPLHRGLVVTATPEGERHEMGLLILGLLLRRQGIEVLHLGADLPAPDLARLVAENAASIVCLATASEVGHPGLQRAVDALAPSDARIAIGGGGPLSPGSDSRVVRLSPDLRTTTATVLRLL